MDSISTVISTANKQDDMKIREDNTFGKSPQHSLENSDAKHTKEGTQDNDKHDDNSNYSNNPSNANNSQLDHANEELTLNTKDDTIKSLNPVSHNHDNDSNNNLIGHDHSDILHNTILHDTTDNNNNNNNILGEDEGSEENESKEDFSVNNNKAQGPGNIELSSNSNVTNSQQNSRHNHEEETADLKIDLSSDIDNDDFSKLYDFDSKNDGNDDSELFSAHEILQASIGTTNNTSKNNSIPTEGDIYVSSNDNNYINESLHKNDTDEKIIANLNQSIKEELIIDHDLKNNIIEKDNNTFLSGSTNHVHDKEKELQIEDEQKKRISNNTTFEANIEPVSKAVPYKEEITSPPQTHIIPQSEIATAETHANLIKGEASTRLTDNITDVPPLDNISEKEFETIAASSKLHENIGLTSSDIAEKSLNIEPKRQNSIIPGMFHPNELHNNQNIQQSNTTIYNPDNNVAELHAENIPDDNHGTLFNNNNNNNNPNINKTDISELPEEQPTIFAYARLDFQSFTFYVQTLHAVIGRRSENDTTHKVDVNLGPSKSISRRHAQIFYNFGTGRFELSVIGKNGAFVDDVFVERGNTVPLRNKTKIQIGQIPFQFVLPEKDRNPSSSEKGTEESNNKITDMKSEKNKHNADAEGKATKVKKEPASKKKKATKANPPAVKKEKEKKPPKPPKKIYTIDEIPVEYRTKPTFSYSAMLTTCIRNYSGENGMSLSEIYGGIRELYPYYKYCPDGWQSSVRHNLSLNKSFRKVCKKGKGWLWGLDEVYIAEREKLKKKQAEAAAAKAQAAQLRLEQQNKLKNKRIAENAAKKSRLNNGGSKQSISQTLASNRDSSKNSNSAMANKVNDHQRTMKYLQEQLIILTRDRKGLPKQTIATILTQALAMTINQVTQAAKSKGISGNPLTALMDKNPQHLNLILAAAVNAATAKVTNGKVKQLVSPTVLQTEAKAAKPKPVLPSKAQPAATSSSKAAQSPASSSSTPIAVMESTTRENVNHTTQSVPNNQQEQKNNNDNSSSSTFDPTSLSRFFQPRNQQNRAQPTSTNNNTNSTGTTANQHQETYNNNNVTNQSMINATSSIQSNHDNIITSSDHSTSKDTNINANNINTSNHNDSDSNRNIGNNSTLPKKRSHEESEADDDSSDTSSDTSNSSSSDSESGSGSGSDSGSGSGSESDSGSDNDSDNDSDGDSDNDSDSGSDNDSSSGDDKDDNGDDNDDQEEVESNKSIELVKLASDTNEGEP